MQSVSRIQLFFERKDTHKAGIIDTPCKKVYFIIKIHILLDYGGVGIFSQHLEIKRVEAKTIPKSKYS